MLENVLEVLKNSGVCILPSDTCYLLAVDATNQVAVDKLLKLKTSLVGKPISVVMANIEMVEEYCEINNQQKKSLQVLLPGPYTVVLKAKNKLACGIISKQNTVGIRITKNKFLQDLVAKLGRPFTATSAGLYEGEVPYSIAYLDRLSSEKRKLIDQVYDTGELPRKNLSTVVNLVSGEVLSREQFTSKTVESIVTKSAEETEMLGVETLHATSLQEHKALVFLLVGDLGGGKTTFSKGVARALGIKEVVTSPTFGIINEYKIDCKNYKRFLHMDLYRLDSQEDFDNLDFLNLFDEKTIACIEWPEKMSKIDLEILKNKTKVMIVNFGYVDENTRKISF